MIGKRFRSLPFIFANDNYTLSHHSAVSILILQQMLYNKIPFCMIIDFINFTTQKGSCINKEFPCITLYLLTYYAGISQ